jgi:hypothetical protein
MADGPGDPIGGQAEVAARARKRRREKRRAESKARLTVG